MPKDSREKLPRGGVSQRVRRTTFVHPSQQHLYSSDPPPASTSRQRNIRNEKITSVLGPQAREEEIRESDAMMRETLQNMDRSTRQLLQDIQTQAGVATMDDTYAIDDYDTSIADPFAEDDAWFDSDDIVPPTETMNIIAAAHDLRRYLLKGHRRVDTRTWKERRTRELQAWNPLIEPLVESYMEWKYAPQPEIPDHDIDQRYPYHINVVEIFTMKEDITIHQRPTSTCVAVDLARHGYLAKTPFKPQVAVGFRTLEIFHRVRLRKASLSVEAFTRVICDYYDIPFRRYLRTVLAETYEVYLRIINVVQKRIHNELTWNTPNWRVMNACKACCYKLQDEPETAYSRLWAHDGNNSLKRMLPLKNRIAADTRVYSDSDYFLPRAFVDRFANEVKSGPRLRHREICSAGQDSDSEDDPDPEDTSGGHEGDPTDGAQDASTTGVDQCVKNWKAAASDEKKRTWAIFDETGIYASACRHGLILWICDMVRSGELAKYPLSILAKALEVLPPQSASGMDINCGFEITAGRSSLAEDIKSKAHKFVVKNHPTVVSGVGIEDFENMERIFSASNALASITRYASPYRRQLIIDTYFRQWDEDKYENLGSFIFNNYKQALSTLHRDVPALESAMEKFRLSDADLDRLEREEAEFLSQLGKEPEHNSLQVEYVELLQALQAALTEKTKAESSYYGQLGDATFIAETAESIQAGYSQLASATNQKEKRRRLARERYDTAQHDVIQIEVQLGVDRRWEPTDPEYRETLKYIRDRKYHRALDKVHQLVVQRLFELQRMNISGLGYKLRTQMAKSLQTRSKTIRTAIVAYNKAASDLTPPRPSLDWSDVSHYGLIEQYTMLRATNHNVSNREWSQPVYREILKCRRRVARAKEELIRCNIETRRLHTSIYDETIHFKTLLTKLKEDDSAMYGPTKAFVRHRTRIHQSLLKRVRQIISLVGFTGESTRGVRIGTENTSPADVGNNETGDDSDGPGDEGLAALHDEDGLDEDAEDFENDDELHNDIDGLQGFMDTVCDS
ncbi:hypothetical protein QCA50_005666 [Cerrena zonata]|uniref:Uncharacterized protein n=1 Tax=Cerrena zonata TaxID=2478898 RepID=A0AAW0GAX3_9APHY